MVDVADQVYPKTLGRGTQTDIVFRFSVAGSVIDLEAAGYTVDVFVESAAGAVTGPFAAVVSGTSATYTIQENDLAVASDTTTDYVRFVASATNGTSTLISDARAITVGDWGGAG